MMPQASACSSLPLAPRCLPIRLRKHLAQRGFAIPAGGHMRSFRNFFAAMAVTGSMLCNASPMAAEGALRDFVVQAGVPVPFIGALPIYIGQRVGFFRQAGLDVQIRYSSNASQATQLAAADKADVALTTAESPLNGREHGIRGKFFMRYNNQLNYFIAVPESSSIRDVKDLADKKIGVANLGSSSVAVARSILRNAGVEAKPDMFLPVGVANQAVSALNSNAVQALALYDAMYSALERSGYRFRYFLHPTLSTFGNAGVFASDSKLSSREADICLYSRAYVESALFMVTNPEAALRIWWGVIPSAKAGTTEDEALKTGLVEVKELIRTTGSEFPPQRKYGSIDKAAFKAYMGLLKQEGAINQMPEIDDVVSNKLNDCINNFDPEQVRRTALNWKS